MATKRTQRAEEVVRIYSSLLQPEIYRDRRFMNDKLAQLANVQVKLRNQLIAGSYDIKDKTLRLAFRRLKVKLERDAIETYLQGKVK